jgi:hypothetical protein
MESIRSMERLSRDILQSVEELEAADVLLDFIIQYHQAENPSPHLSILYMEALTLLVRIVDYQESISQFPLQ